MVRQGEEALRLVKGSYFERNNRYSEQLWIRERRRVGENFFCKMQKAMPCPSIIFKRSNTKGGLGGG